MDEKRQPEIDRLRQQYEHETDEEIERKRMVYLAFIVRHEEEQARIAADAGDLELNRIRYEVLSEIVRARQKARSDRERRAEVLSWAQFGAAFIGGAITSPLAAALWAWVSRILETP